MTTVVLSNEQLEVLARKIAQALEPYAKLRAKKFLRPATASLIYDVSPDYLRKQSVDALPRVHDGPNLTRYPVEALDNFFRRHLLHG